MRDARLHIYQPNLRTLKLSGTGINLDRRVFPEGKYLTKLRKIKMQRNWLGSNCVFNALSGARNLEELDLSYATNSDIRDVCFQFVRRLRRLRIYNHNNNKSVLTFSHLLGLIRTIVLLVLVVVSQKKCCVT